MEDLTRHFPGCAFTTEELRNTIRRCIGLSQNDYFCYKCFRFLGLGVGIPKNALLCKGCYQFYCQRCSVMLRSGTVMEIDPSLCLQCVDTRRFS